MYLLHNIYTLVLRRRYVDHKSWKIPIQIPNTNACCNTMLLFFFRRQLFTKDKIKILKCVGCYLHTKSCAGKLFTHIWIFLPTYLYAKRRYYSFLVCRRIHFHTYSISNTQNRYPHVKIKWLTRFLNFKQNFPSSFFNQLVFFRRSLKRTAKLV